MFFAFLPVAAELCLVFAVDLVPEFLSLLLDDMDHCLVSLQDPEPRMESAPPHPPAGRDRRFFYLFS